MARAFGKTTLVILWACSCFPSAPAQSVVTADGLHRVSFQVAAGSIRLNLPSDASAGDRVIATVFPAPAGSNDGEKQRNLAELAKYGFSFGGQASMRGDRIVWVIPSVLSPERKTVRLVDGGNRTVAACELPIVPVVADAPGFVPPTDILLPDEGVAGSFLSIWGAFPPPSVVSARVGSKEALLMAQSPRKAIFLAPGDVVGPSTIEAKVGDYSARGAFRSIRIQLAMDISQLRTGQTTDFDATVSGLWADPSTGPTENRELVVTNKTPEVVAVSGGAVQRIPIRFSDLRADGTFRFSQKVTGMKRGSFELTAVMHLPLMSLAERIVDRWSRRNEIEVGNSARNLIAGGTSQASTLLDSVFGAQMAFAADPSDLVDALVREYCFNLRNAKLRESHLVGFRTPPGGIHSPMGFGFQPQTTTSTVVIDTQTVQRRTFLQFLAAFLESLKPTNPWGRIVVMSTPPNQGFRVDKGEGFEYVTNQTLSVTVGLHRVTVGTCTQQVEVRPNQVSAVNCLLRQ